jgi:hypothetical protein
LLSLSSLLDLQPSTKQQIHQSIIMPMHNGWLPREGSTIPASILLSSPS